LHYNQIKTSIKDMIMAENVTDPMAEINAMKAVAEALSGLDSDATARVLQWAGGRFGVAVSTRTKVGDAKAEVDETSNAGAAAAFESLADLYSATAPKTDADRALIAGYWYQFIDAQEDFASQTINSALKHLGHGVSNITKALETLKGQSPALVMQVRKSGSSQQARKKYKLTAAGKKAVDLLINHA
jgi:hypothetical protein